MRRLTVDADQVLSPLAREQVRQLQAAAEAFLKLPFLKLKLLPPRGRRRIKVRLVLTFDGGSLARTPSPGNGTPRDSS